MRIVRMSRGYLCFQRDGNSFTSLAMPVSTPYLEVSKLHNGEFRESGST